MRTHRYYLARDDVEALQRAGGAGGVETGVDPARALAHLERLLAGERFDTVTSDPEWYRVVGEGPDGSVTTTTRTLQQELAASRSGLLDDVARAWTSSEEDLEALGEDEARRALLALALLAREAEESGERVYCLSRQRPPAPAPYRRARRR